MYSHDAFLYTELQFHAGTTTLSDVQASVGGGALGSTFSELLNDGQGQWYLLWGGNVYATLVDGQYISIQVSYPQWPSPPSTAAQSPMVTMVQCVDFSMATDPRFTTVG